MSRSIQAVAIAILLVAGLGVLGCENMSKKKENESTKEAQMKDTMKERADQSASQAGAMGATATAMVKPSGAATTQPTNNNVSGSVTFVQTGADTIKVVVDLTGLAPNTKHGFHIHEKGDLSDPELKSAGAHFNPAKHMHGGPDSPLAHAGDLGNITSDANGNVRTEMTVKGISLDANSPNNIVGRSVLVHAKDDDLKTDPSGNSGARIAGGQIVMAK